MRPGVNEQNIRRTVATVDLTFTRQGPCRGLGLLFRYVLLALGDSSLLRFGLETHQPTLTLVLYYGHRNQELAHQEVRDTPHGVTKDEAGQQTSGLRRDHLLPLPYNVEVTGAQVRP